MKYPLNQTLELSTVKMGARVSSVSPEDEEAAGAQNTEGQGPAKVLQEDTFFGLDVNYKSLVFGDAIGHGTYGKVFKSEYDGYNVAVKLLFMSAEPDERAEILEDFAKEVNILSQLKHKCIVKFLGAVRNDPNYCLLFELCEGSVGNLLSTARKRQINITYGMCLKIAGDCAEAMAYLHGLSPKILHRDLKAENLLLDRNFNCKLTDFGLSRGYEAKSVMTVCGTPCWVAPEIFRGEAYTETVDVYSFAIVLWELFCFEKPYGDQDAVELPYLVAKENLRPPVLTHCSESLNQLMTNCWDGNMTARPNFEQILDTLRNIEQEWQPYINKPIDPSQENVPA